MERKEQLIYVQDIFASFSRWQAAGFLSRQIDLFNRFSKYFDTIYILTSDDDKFKNEFNNNIYHIYIPYRIPFKRIFYFFLSGAMIKKDVKYVEINGVTGIFPAIIYKIMGKHIFLENRWDLSKTLMIHNRKVLAIFAKIITIIAFNVADIIAVPTEAQRSEAAKYTNYGKIFLLPNFVDTELFKPIRNIKKINNLLIFVGRLHEDKNLFLLLDVMRELPEFRLWIVGNGPLRESLILYMKENEINNVDILGTIDYNKIPLCLNKAEAFILVSHIEGQPKVLMEAMACGLPCIGTNVLGIRDIITNDYNGLLCDVSCKNVIETIKYLFNDKSKMRSLGENSRLFAVENFSMEKYIELKINLIKRDC